MKNDGSARDMLNRISKNATQKSGLLQLFVHPLLPLHSLSSLLPLSIPFTSSVRISSLLSCYISRPPPHTQPRIQAPNSFRDQETEQFIFCSLFRGDTTEKVCLVLRRRRNELSITSTFRLQKKIRLSLPAGNGDHWSMCLGQL